VRCQPISAKDALNSAFLDGGVLRRTHAVNCPASTHHALVAPEKGGGRSVRGGLPAVREALGHGLRNTRHAGSPYGGRSGSVRVLHRPPGCAMPTTRRFGLPTSCRNAARLTLSCGTAGARTLAPYMLAPLSSLLMGVHTRAYTDYGAHHVLFAASATLVFVVLLYLPPFRQVRSCDARIQRERGGRGAHLAGGAAR
jgi:hypothetical protein